MRNIRFLFACALVPLICAAADSAAQTPSTRPAVQNLPAVAPAGGRIAPPQTQPAAQGPLRLRDPVHDFGEVYSGEPVKHTFRMVNTGDKPVRILRVLPGCSCTTTEPWANEVQPGQTWELAVELDTHGRKGQTSKVIRVETDDPLQKTVNFTLTGNLVERFTYEPAAYVNFGPLRPESDEKRTVIIANQLERPVHLKDATVDSGLYRVELRELEPGRRYALDAQTVPPLKGSNGAATVTIRTDLPEHPEIRLPMRGWLQPDVVLAPERLLVAQPLSGDLRRRLLLRSNTDTPLHVEEVVSSLPDVEVRVEERTPGKEYEVWVLMPKGLEIPAHGATVTLFTDNPKYDVMVVELQPFRLPERRNPIGQSGTAATRPAAAAQPLR